MLMTRIAIRPTRFLCSRLLTTMFNRKLSLLRVQVVITQGMQGQRTLCLCILRPDTRGKRRMSPSSPRSEGAPNQMSLCPLQFFMESGKSATKKSLFFLKRRSGKELADTLSASRLAMVRYHPFSVLWFYKLTRLARRFKSIQYLEIKNSMW